jgi:class 3 adenylate cyclase
VAKSSAKGGTLREREEETGRGSAAAFYDLVADYSQCSDPAEQERLDGEIWRRYGTSGVVMITDMEGFSVTTRSLGICHFLGMIERARRIVVPVVAANSGLLLKCEADNCYAFFQRTEDALQTAIDLNAAVQELGGGRHGPGVIELAIGIDYGRLLLVGDEDFYGDPVNTASKLGEDLGGGGEILVTDRALERAATLPGVCSDQLVTRISGIDIQYRRFTAA